MNSYPFLTKTEIRNRIASGEAPFIVECLLAIANRQTEDEHDAKATRWKNRRGFMSSHAVNGTKLADKALSGEAFSEEDLGKAGSMVSHYTKQLAAHFRQKAVAEDPELEAAARLFSAV